MTQPRCPIPLVSGDSSPYYHKMDVPLVTDAQVVGLISLGLVTTVATGLAWSGRHRRPDGQVEPPGSPGEHNLRAAMGHRIAPAASTTNRCWTG